jgi:hypothetical protein
MSQYFQINLSDDKLHDVSVYSQDAVPLCIHDMPFAYPPKERSKRAGASTIDLEA